MTTQAHQAKGQTAISLPNPVTLNARVKRKNNLKAKVHAVQNASGDATKQKGGPILGDVDYVTLMMGGRRKSQNEANKMKE